MVGFYAKQAGLRVPAGQVGQQQADVAGLLGEALAAARDPAATLIRLVEDLDPAEVAQLRAALDAAAEEGSPQ